MRFDVAIVGAGPAGLTFARMLAGSGLTVTLIEPQPAAALADPPFDGREIAMTHATRRLLESAGIWERIDPAEISALRDARVFNGPSRFSMKIEAGLTRQDQLGFLVPNHLIRRAAFEAARTADGVRLDDGVRLTAVHTGSDAARLTLSDGRTLEARLLVAADSRFSETRRMLGIGANSHDFGRTMQVCRMTHEIAHHHVAWEWFGYGQTLALLPLNGNVASTVLTLPPQTMAALAELDDEAFGREMTRRFLGRLGTMRLVSTRHRYPLVGVYAHRFAAPRAALIGDAAVGMHPVTAHGFNFGAQSAGRLAERVLKAHRAGRDIAAEAVLGDYERAHRLATWPLYQSTNLIASLYTDDRTPARLLRNAGLRIAERLTPFKRAVASHLTQG